MAKAQYVGVSGVARKAKQPYVGVDGVARKVKNGFVGVDGVARQFFAGFPYPCTFGHNAPLGTAGDTWSVTNPEPGTVVITQNVATQEIAETGRTETVFAVHGLSAGDQISCKCQYTATQTGWANGYVLEETTGWATHKTFSGSNMVWDFSHKVTATQANFHFQITYGYSSRAVQTLTLTNLMVNGQLVEF